MSSTVSMSVDNSLNLAGMPVQVTCVFANAGVAAVTVTGVSRTSPSPNAASIQDDALKLIGFVIPAASTVQHNFGVLLTTAHGAPVVLSLRYTFSLSDGSAIGPGHALQVTYLDPFSTGAPPNGNPFPLGVCDFRNNHNSALLAVI